jgi:hypothetical protein
MYKMPRPTNLTQPFLFLRSSSTTVDIHTPRSLFAIEDIRTPIPAEASGFSSFSFSSLGAPRTLPIINISPWPLSECNSTPQWYPERSSVPHCQCLKIPSTERLNPHRRRSTAFQTTSSPACSSSFMINQIVAISYPATTRPCAWATSAGDGGISRFRRRCCGRQSYWNM